MKRLVCILHSHVVIGKGFFQCLKFFFLLLSFPKIVVKLFKISLRFKFCTQLNFLYRFFQKACDNIWFTGHHLVSLLDLVLLLPEGAETDLLQNSDR